MKECEYYIPVLPQNLNTDIKDPITFDKMLISAEAIYVYEVSDTTISYTAARPNMNILGM
jgi:hypothetical protein